MAVLLIAEILLWLATRFRWFGFDRNEGYVSLLSFALLSGVLLFMAFWFLAALRWHIRFQYSIRSLLMLALASAISSSWLAVESERASQQREAVQSIEKSGGEVDWDREPWTPAWLCKLVGDDFLGAVKGVYFLSGKHVATPDLKLLHRLTHVRKLYLEYADVTDVDLETVEGLHEIEQLHLAVCPRVTDLGFSHIKGLVHLRILEVVNVPITDEGLRHVGGLIQLEELRLGGTRITDYGIQYISSMSQICELDLSRTRITNAGLRQIREMAGLCRLYLNGTNLNDSGLEHIEGMNQLDSLELKNTYITDRGLTRLESLTNLRHLDLTGTQVTQKGVEELKSALPLCPITWGTGTTL